MLICGVMSLSSQALAAGPPRGDFVDLVKRLSPAVVDVSARSAAKPQGKLPDNLPKDHPFRRFFDEFNRDSKPNRNMRSLGSGFIIDPKGIIVTNYHVIKDGSDIKINLSDGRRFDVEIVGSDPYADIAVLRIKSKQRLNLPSVQFGDPNAIQVGEWVFAIGTPFGLRGTVTAGIVSAVHRDIGAGPYDDFIQTDAAINKGNSGGPLFNTRGQVVGINTVILSPSGVSAGAGFAIPVSTALPIIDQLIKTGKTSRGWLGVQIQDITEALAETIGLKEPKGALVAVVTPDSPADKAGIKTGDVIVKFNGQDIGQMRELPKLVSTTAVGSRARVEVIRNGRAIQFEVVLGRLEDAMAQASPAQQQKPKKRQLKYGMALVRLDANLRRRQSIPDEIRGVWVQRVDPNSAAADSGLRGGEVILEANRQKVRAPKDVYRLIDRAKRGKKKAILLRIWRGGSAIFLALALE